MAISLLDKSRRVRHGCFMPNPWTGIGNPYTRNEVIERLQATLSKRAGHHRRRRRHRHQRQVHRKGRRRSHHHLQFRPLPHDGPRLHRRHDGLRRCQRDRHGNRRIRGAAGGRGSAGDLRCPRHRPAPPHVALARQGEGDGVFRGEQFPDPHHRRRPLPRGAGGNRHERAQGV
jgi:hypothetical protein